MHRRLRRQSFKKLIFGPVQCMCTLYSSMCTWIRWRRASIPQTQKFHESNTHKRFKHTVKNVFNTFIVGIRRDAHHGISIPLWAVLSSSFFSFPLHSYHQRCTICYCSYRFASIRVTIHHKHLTNGINSSNDYGSNGDGCNTISNRNINIIQSMKI